MREQGIFGEGSHIASREQTKNTQNFDETFCDEMRALNLSGSTEKTNSLRNTMILFFSSELKNEVMRDGS